MFLFVCCISLIAVRFRVLQEYQKMRQTAPNPPQGVPVEVAAEPGKCASLNRPNVQIAISCAHLYPGTSGDLVGRKIGTLIYIQELAVPRFTRCFMDINESIHKPQGIRPSVSWI